MTFRDFQIPKHTNSMIEPLDEEKLRESADLLTKSHPPLAAVIIQHGYPPLWARQPGFATVIHIILEQQVSLASALSAFKKLEAALPAITPENFITLDDAQLKAVGFSRQKIRYGRDLAHKILQGELDLPALATLPDERVCEELIKVKGIGIWTANIYLLMVLCRPDVWPTGDRALAVAAKNVLGLEHVPTYPQLDDIARTWRPHRATAARILWHDYLERKK